MGGDSVLGTSKLSKVKAAAQEFATRPDSPDSQIGVVGFGSQAHVTRQLTTDRPAIGRAIDAIADGGGTAMHDGLAAAQQLLSSASLPRNVLLFTDGFPDSADSALKVAEMCRQSGDLLLKN